jgi:hypothetical protein
MSISITLGSTSRYQVRLPAVWWALAILSIVATAWCRIIGLSFSDAPSKVLHGAMLAIAAVGIYRLSDPMSGGIKHLLRRLSGVCESFALWTVLVTAVCAVCYCSATVAAPFRDELPQLVDRWLGFDWLAWSTLVHGIPWLHWVLGGLYASLLAQSVLSSIYLPLVGRVDRVRELVLLCVVTWLFTAAVFTTIPAIGPFGTFSPNDPEIVELLMMRSPGPWVVSYAAAQGIVVMPSYHTVLAVLFVYAFRGTAIFPAVLLVNLAMLPSIPPIGGHYLADMLAGAAIAISSIAVVHLMRANAGSR